jgi:hypothetical protein
MLAYPLSSSSIIIRGLILLMRERKTTLSGVCSAGEGGRLKVLEGLNHFVKQFPIYESHIAREPPYLGLFLIAYLSVRT